LRRLTVQRLFATQPVRVQVSCGAACDVRTVMHHPDGFVTAAGRTLLRAGTTRIGLSREIEARRVRIVVHAGAPGGHRTAAATVRVRVMPRRSLPVPRPLGVHALRRGREIVVRWHTARPARRAFFLVEGRPRRRERSAEVVDFTRGGGRRRFSLRLEPRHPGRVRWVAVVAGSIDSGRALRPVLASVP
jgi:hypothetical protein